MVMSSRLVTSPVMTRDAPIVVIGQLRIRSAVVAGGGGLRCVCPGFRRVWFRPVGRCRTTPHARSPRRPINLPVRFQGLPSLETPARAFTRRRTGRVDAARACEAHRVKPAAPAETVAKWSVRLVPTGALVALFDAFRRSPSSRGLGRGPFKAETRVRIPVGTPTFALLSGEGCPPEALRAKAGSSPNEGYGWQASGSSQT